MGASFASVPFTIVLTAQFPRSTEESFEGLDLTPVVISRHSAQVVCRRSTKWCRPVSHVLPVKFLVPHIPSLSFISLISLPGLKVTGENSFRHR